MTLDELAKEIRDVNKANGWNIFEAYIKAKIDVNRGRGFRPGGKRV